MKKILHGLNLFLKFLSTVFVVVLVFLAVSLVGVRLFGIDVYTVLSGSMEPTYHTGSILYVKDVDPATLQVGDAVTFSIGEDATATHRIVSMVPAENDPSTVLFQTKGDANDMVDAQPVSFDDVVGKPVFTIPYLGYLADFIQSKSGRYICIVVVALVILLTVLSELLEDSGEETEKKKNKKKKKKPETKEETPLPAEDKKEEKTNEKES